MGERGGFSKSLSPEKRNERRGVAVPLRLPEPVLTSHEQSEARRPAASLGTGCCRRLGSLLVRRQLEGPGLSWDVWFRSAVISHI